MSAAAALSLYDIESELTCLLDSRDMIPDDEPGMRAELDDQIYELVKVELQKADGICQVLSHFEAQALLAAAEIKRLQSRKKSFESRAAMLEASAQRAMELRGVLKIDGETSTLALQEAPASVLILDEVLIPKEYKTCHPEEWTPDKRKIAAALKKGIDVPGADLSEGNLYLVRR